MKYAHKISIRVFLKPEEKIEDPEIEKKIKDALIWLLPINEQDLAKEKISIQEEKVEGFDNRTISIISVVLTKDAHINAFIKKFVSLLNSDQKDLILSQAESRLDDELDFFVRLGKQELMRNDIHLTDSGECFHLRLGIAAFPRKKDAALKVISEIFK